MKQGTKGPTLCLSHLLLTRLSLTVCLSSRSALAHTRKRNPKGGALLVVFLQAGGRGAPGRKRKQTTGIGLDQCCHAAPAWPLLPLAKRDESLACPHYCDCHHPAPPPLPTARAVGKRALPCGEKAAPEKAKQGQAQVSVVITAPHAPCPRRSARPATTRRPRTPPPPPRRRCSPPSPAARRPRSPP